MRLAKQFRKEVAQEIGEKFKIDNPMAIPKLMKVVVSMGVGQAVADRKCLDEAVSHLGLITGQRPIVTRAKRAVSSFRLRQGMEIGCKVTLRGERMYEFLERFVSLALPRVRDFRGLSSKGFDGNGNYSVGLSEQSVFPEVPSDKVSHNQGMNITVVTSTNVDDQAFALLAAFGFPFQQRQ